LFDHDKLQGLVDLDAEIAKCEKKLHLARLNLDKVQKVEAQPDYSETVPENVRLINEDRVCVFP
jgi:valyl-tRNA synthetase